MEKSFLRSGCGLIGLILVVLVAGFFGDGPLPWAKARWETYRSRRAYHEGTYEQALARANVAIDERPNYRLAHYLKGLAQEQLRDHDGAIASYTRAIELDESRASQALAYRGGIYARFGGWEKAAPDFERAVALEPDNSTVRINYGVALGNEDRDAEALVHHDRAVELDPTSAV